MPNPDCLVHPPRKSSAVSQVMIALSEYIETETPLWRLKEEAGAAKFALRVASGAWQRRRAQTLAHEVYREAGLADDDRISHAAPWDARPTTLVLLAEDEQGRAAATVSLVFDGAEGLPCDEIFNEELRGRRSLASRLVEVTRLAIREKYKSNKLLLVRLFNFIYLYARRVHGWDEFVIEVHPRHVRFYEALLGFTVLGESRPCPRVNGSPAVLLSLDLAYSEQEVARVAGQPGPKTRSLYPYFYAGVEEEAAFMYLKEHPAPAGFRRRSWHDWSAVNSSSAGDRAGVMHV